MRGIAMAILTGLVFIAANLDQTQPDAKGWICAVLLGVTLIVIAGGW